MTALVPWLVFLHILSAIVAFGPTFAFAIYGAQAGKEPQHANFMARANHLVSDRLVLPLVLSMPVTGLLIVWASGLNVMASTWLLVAIVIYIGAVLYTLLVQRPATLRMVELTSSPPPPGATGPSPELMATGAKIRRGGMILGVAVIVIVAMMVLKPTL